MGFMRNKNEGYDQLGVKKDDRKMYIKVYIEKESKAFEGMIYDWQLDSLLKLEYIMIDSDNEYKIDKIFFDLCQSTVDCNCIYIYATRIENY